MSTKVIRYLPIAILCTAIVACDGSTALVTADNTSGESGESEFPVIDTPNLNVDNTDLNINPDIDLDTSPDTNLDANPDIDPDTSPDTNPAIVAKIISEASDSSDKPEGLLVSVTVPDDVILEGTALISLEDSFIDDLETVEIHSVSVPAEDLRDDGEVSVFIPVPLDSNVEVAVTVFVDQDNSGSVSAGDLISTELAYFDISDEPKVLVNLLPL